MIIESFNCEINSKNQSQNNCDVLKEFVINQTVYLKGMLLSRESSFLLDIVVIEVSEELYVWKRYENERSFNSLLTRPEVRRETKLRG